MRWCSVHASDQRPGTSTADPSRQPGTHRDNRGPCKRDEGRPGTIQEVGPLGTVGYRRPAERRKDGTPPPQGLCDKDLRNIAKLNNLRCLTAAGTSVTDLGAAYLKDLKRLVRLNLQGTKITDAALQRLSGLNRLERLDLSRTAVGDAGLRHLAGLHRLGILDVSFTNVTDEGLKTLQNLTRLQVLNLAATHVTDVGLEHLKSLTNLQSLNLMDTEVTNKGRESIRQEVLEKAKAVATIIDNGGKVTVDEKCQSKPVIGVDLRTPWLPILG